MVQNPKYSRARKCARLQNKTQLTRSVFFSLFHFQVESYHILLLSNMLAFAPCDLQPQRAYHNGRHCANIYLEQPIFGISCCGFL